MKDSRKIKSVKLHIFSDASDKACSSATIAVVEQGLFLFSAINWRHG